ncbi:beta-N-acetylhexosaminidase [Methylophaga thiooxydans]|uniref:Beta-hexosaminidase n=1 Tax=Methylophaga thiooxydans DMS010 TaxID=637616 RepID=C0N7R8_9GAMM|nr:beta-N-acetylhexosaminidase [Methylophaga thiooxydans]EEF79498.1 Glycosyl hydrolase family 3 N terminal domain protein [Methylophaga thiooxydans DMS010]
MTLGPLMVDLLGTTLSPEEREILQHPLVGGVILFSRNFDSAEQITRLCSEIHQLRDPHLLISVDHEGGRVQRFRQDFTRLPPVAAIGKDYMQHPQAALQKAEQTGWLMAAELRAVGIDFSFAPVLDLNYGVSQVIGDRAFHRDPKAVTDIARAYIHGMKKAWMSAVGKHFPGHGAVEVDSHIGLPVDNRYLEDMLQADMLPFRQLCQKELAGIMPAHIVYEKNDAMPAGFSRFWLQDILRERFGFQGAILSDDLSMEGAAFIGGPLERAEAALEAGCDMVLVCNNPGSVENVIDGLQIKPDPLRHARLVRLHGRHSMSRDDLLATAEWKQASETIAAYAPDPEMELNLA